jgi:hypothetical protein
MPAQNGRALLTPMKRTITCKRITSFFSTGNFLKTSCCIPACSWCAAKGIMSNTKPDEDFTAYGLPYPVQGNDTLFTTDLTRQLWLDNYFYGSLFSLQYQQGKTALTFGGAATNIRWHPFRENHLDGKKLNGPGAGTMWMLPNPM